MITRPLFASRPLFALATLTALTAFPAIATAEDPDPELLRPHVRSMKVEDGRIVRVSIDSADFQDPDWWGLLAKSEGLDAMQIKGAQSQDFERISRIRSLRSLTFAGGRFTDEDMIPLRELEHLKTLHIHHNRGLNGDFLAILPDLHDLEHLILHNIRPWKASEMRHLAEVESLESIHLTALPVSVEDLEPLRGHENLSEVVFADDDFDGVVRFLATLPDLRDIELLRSEWKPIDDELVRLLASRENLHKIRSVNVAFTRDQVDLLQEALPDLELDMRKDDGGHTDSYPVEPEG